MKKTTLLKSMLLLCALIVGSGSSWATDITYTFTSKSWAANDGSGSANWTNVSDGNGFTSGQGIQVTTGTTGANATSPVSFVNITKIVVTYNTNASKGAGSIEIKIGTNESTSNSVGYSGSDDGTSANFTTQFNYATPQSGTVKLTTNTTTNSIWVKSVKITYTPEPYTVTYGDTGGTVTEASAGAGVTLVSRSSVGSYTFAGWSTTNVSTETTTAPTIIPAGTYKPAANLTLYPVYTRTEGSGSPTAFSVGDTGDFAIVSAIQGDDKYYALPTNPTVSSGKITAQEITVSETDGVKFVTPANADGFEWTIAEATNGYTLYDGSKYIYHSNGGASGTNVEYGTGTTYTWSFTKDGDYIKMFGMNGSTVNGRGMLFSGKTIGGYSMSNWSTSGYYKTMILPIVAASTTYYTSLLATITTNKGKWTSFTPSWNATLSTGATAYIITDIDASTVTASSVSVLKAGSGYFVKGEAATTPYKALATADDADDTTGNLLVGQTSATTINATTPNSNDKFVLGTTSGGTSGLFKVNSDVTIAAGKAYLNSGTTGLANSLNIDFEDGAATGIQTIEVKKELLEGDFYNLKGQRVAQPSKGLYIINGRKVVIK